VTGLSQIKTLNAIEDTHSRSIINRHASVLNLMPN